MLPLMQLRAAASSADAAKHPARRSSAWELASESSQIRAPVAVTPVGNFKLRHVQVRERICLLHAFRQESGRCQADPLHLQGWRRRGVMQSRYPCNGRVGKVSCRPTTRLAKVVTGMCHVEPSRLGRYHVVLTELRRWSEEHVMQSCYNLFLP